MKILDFVTPIKGYYDSGAGCLSSGCSIYSHAIVVSLNPFVLSSESGDMLWFTKSPENYKVIATATQKEAKLAIARYQKSENE